MYISLRKRGAAFLNDEVEVFCQVLFLGFLYIEDWGRFLISSHPCYVLNDLCVERHLRRIGAHRLPICIKQCW